MTRPGFNAHQARESAPRSRSGGITPPRMGTYHDLGHEVGRSGLVRWLAVLVAVAVVAGIVLAVLGGIF